MNNLKDTAFLKVLNEQRIKPYYAKIIVLDKLETPIKSIEGRILQGSSISINGSSSMRRTCNLSMIADEEENDLTDIDNFLNVNKKIKIAVGIDKWVDYSKDIIRYDKKDDFPSVGEIGKIYVDHYDTSYWKYNGKTYQKLSSLYEYEKDLVWFPLGTFIITQPNISHSTSGCNINLSCKDKMCLLNGEMGGNLPTSVTFHEYNQIIGELVCNTDPRFDKDLQLNNYTVYHYNDNYYTWTKEYGWFPRSSDSAETQAAAFLTNKESIGETITVPQLIYDIIYTSVVNYGGENPENIIINDVPLEIKQIIRYIGSAPLYYNTSTKQYTTNEINLVEDGTWVEYNFNEDIGYTYTDFVYPGKLITNIGDNVCNGVLDKIVQVLGNYEYFYDIDGNFVFQEKRNYLNTAYVPTEINNNTHLFYIDNNRDFQIDTNSLKIIGSDNYKIDYYGDQQSVYTFNEGSNLVTAYTNSPKYTNLKNDYHIWGKNSDGYAIHYHVVIKEPPQEFLTRKIIFLKKEDGEYSGRIRLPKEDEIGYDYTPSDWRAELYLQGLEISKAGGRPDIYQQELLDLFDNIYEWGYYNSIGEFIREGRFKTDIVNRPNTLNYFIDYLEPTDRLYGLEVDDIGTKIYSHQQDKICRLYNNDIPNCIVIDQSMDTDYIIEVESKCDESGQPHSIVDHALYNKFAIGTVGYSAQEVARELLYQYTTYNETITLQCIPIYTLDANQRITVRDKKSNINGDFIINSMTVPLSPNNTMSITASKALTRI